MLQALFGSFLEEFIEELGFGIRGSPAVLSYTQYDDDNETVMAEVLESFCFPSADVPL